MAEVLQTNAAELVPGPWQEGASPLGIRALRAQHAEWQPPADTAQLTAADWAALYYLPLAQSDLVIDSLCVPCEVLAVEQDLEPGSEPVAEDELTGFRLRLRGTEGERTELADVVIDASGTNSQTWGLAPGTPDFYILGAKNAVAAADFSIADGLAQIRELFRIVFDRADLDLYAANRGETPSTE